MDLVCAISTAISMRKFCVASSSTVVSMQESCQNPSSDSLSALLSFMKHSSRPIQILRLWHAVFRHERGFEDPAFLPLRQKQRYGITRLIQALGLCVGSLRTKVAMRGLALVFRSTWSSMRGDTWSTSLAQTPRHSGARICVWRLSSTILPIEEAIVRSFSIDIHDDARIVRRLASIFYSTIVRMRGLGTLPHQQAEESRCFFLDETRYEDLVSFPFLFRKKEIEDLLSSSPRQLGRDEALLVASRPAGVRSWPAVFLFRPKRQRKELSRVHSRQR